MKLIRIIFLFFCVIATNNATADSAIKIKRWQEETVLNDSGKSSEILIEGAILGLPQNKVLSGFFLQFSPERNLKITKVICDSSSAKYSFKDNVLSLEFNKNKKVNDKISIYISYEEKYEKIRQFLRQELIDIPPFAAGADATVIVRFPSYLESATLNPEVKKMGRGFVYRNLVPQDGVREIIKLTPSETTWDVKVKVKINSTQPVKNLRVSLPTYFDNGGQTVKNNIVVSSVTTSDKIIEGNRQILKFPNAISNLYIENRATVLTGQNNETAVRRNQQQYLQYSQQELAAVSPLLTKIKNDSQYSRFPLYARIGKFVHDYIKYDISYIGKLPDLDTILRDKIGVCTEYAKLYDTIARVAGIPSLVINGAACGEYDNCQGHSWNMIYYNNKWIYVDPTWDLMSGTVSSSHIYFNDGTNEGVEVKYSGKEGELKSDIDFEMQEKNL